jgi:hypothetical protein
MSQKLFFYAGSIIIAAVIVIMLLLFVFACNGQYIAHPCIASVILLPLRINGIVYAPRGWYGRRLVRWFKVADRILKAATHDIIA